MDELVGNPEFISTVETNPPLNPKENPRVLVPGNGGATFENVTEVTIVAKFTPGKEVPVNKIVLPNPNSNAEIVAVKIFKAPDDKNPEVILSNNGKEPIYPTTTEPVSKIQIVITSSDGLPLHGVEISIQSCSHETTVSTPGVPTTTQAQPQPEITTGM